MGAITIHNTWKLWPLWAGPLIVIGSPLIVLAMHIPCLLFLPCILLQGPVERRQQRVARAALQMEEGRRTNQRYIDAANAEAARLAALRPAPERAAPEAPHERDGTGGDARGSPPANDAKGNDTSTVNDGTSKDTPPSGGATEPESIEKPAVIPGNDIASTVAPPAPAHIDR